MSYLVNQGQPEAAFRRLFLTKRKVSLLVALVLFFSCFVAQRTSESGSEREWLSQRTVKAKLRALLPCSHSLHRDRPPLGRETNAARSIIVQVFDLHV